MPDGTIMDKETQRDTPILENIFGEYRCPKPRPSSRFKKWRAKAGVVVGNMTLGIFDKSTQSPVIGYLGILLTLTTFFNITFPQLSFMQTICIMLYFCGFGLGIKYAAVLKELGDNPFTSRSQILLPVLATVFMTAAGLLA